MKLRSIERMMSRCFKEFPFGGFRMTQYIPELGVIYKNMGSLWRVLLKRFGSKCIINFLMEYFLEYFFFNKLTETKT